MEAEEDELVQESITENESYVYFGWNKSQGDGNHTKIGKTENLKSRESSLNTSFSQYGMNFEYLVKCNSNKEEAEIEEYLQSYFYKHSTMHFENHTGGTEWFNKRFKLEDISEALSKSYSNEIISDLEEINRILNEHTIKYEKAKQKKKENMSKLNKKINKRNEKRQKKIKRDKQSIKDENIWLERQYQTEIIKLGLEKLSEFGKFYLELATGAGKTYIVFNILKYFTPDIIFCLSPRLKINKQNIKADYLELLGDEYETFNLSEDKDIDKFMKKDCKKIIVGCMNSYKKLIGIIKNNNKNSLLWFDESHWGIESWLKTSLNEEQDYLINSLDINYRIFTSASPNTEVVENNERIFGKLYKDITVKELIKLQYLCNIKPFIFETDKEDVDYSQTILTDFKNYNRSWGLSFHTSCINAFNMFLKHYEEYDKKLTVIKPYLIVGESKEFKKDKRLSNVNLDYNYHSFKSYEESKKGIAYVVKMCDMGYDFKNIDYISLTDKKVSYSDLIQCIGRGLRSDKKGDNDKNSDKELYLMIPNYIDEDNSDNFDSIINVIQYLQNDIGLDWEDILYKSYKPGGGASSSSENYEGKKVIKSKLMDAIKLRPPVWNTTNQLVRYCKNNNIHSIKEYHYYREKYISMNLPDVLPIDFNWCDTYRKHKFYNKIDCINKIKEIMESNTDLEYMEDHEEISYILNNIDTKIPNACLWSFYGGSQSEYLVFSI